MSALSLGRYRELLGQLLQLNEQTAALRRELGAWIDSGATSNQGPSANGGGSVAATSPTRRTDEPQSASQPQHTQMDDRVVTQQHWSTMESSSPVGPSNIEDSEPGQPSTTQRTAPPIPERVHYGTTEAVIECTSLQNRISLPPKPSSNESLIPPKPLPRKKPPSTLDFEHIELIDEDADDSLLNGRKPHFLDDDYQLHKNGMCSIPKPHFLEHSPSPDDDRFGDITNPHFLDDGSDVCVPTRRKDPALPYYQPTAVDRRSNQGVPTALTREKLEERNSMERRRREVQPNDFLPGQASTSTERHLASTVYDGHWNKDMWQSQDSCSVKSFSSAGSGNAISSSSRQQLGPKENCVYSLLSLLSLSADSNADMSEYLLEMSHSVESCLAMRQSGCIPLLVQLIHSKLSRGSRNKAAKALHNMVHAQPDDKTGRREARVLRLLEHVWEYCQFLEDLVECIREDSEHIDDDMAKHPVQSVAALMKLSFDEEHRHVMCQLGGLQSLASLVTVDQSAHGSLIEHEQCITMRKYSGMALTNLTFGDGNNKALLCSFKDFMMALVEQLKSPNDDMRQVTAAVLRNLSWRADNASKKILRDVGSVKGLTIAAMTAHKEATLKSVLSALWNLTAHCSLNKVDICSVEGALAFLVDMLSFNAPSKTLAIIENAGGILRNVSSHIAIREDYRQILREHNCLKVLLQQLKSPSLTIVSNSCGTLWNLSARCQQDQQFLMDHGAIPMLRSLIHSKHKMIAMGSSAALKNLLNSKPGKIHILSLDSTARDMNLPTLPTLGARKQKALEQELDQNLSETCENIEPVTTPTSSNAAEKHIAMKLDKHRMSSSSPLLGHLVSQISMSQSSHFGGGYLSCSNTLLLQSSLQKGHMSRTMLYGRNENVNRSESRDSVTSTHSDSVYERVTRNSKIPNVNQKISEKAKSSSNSVDNVPIGTDFIQRYSKESSTHLKYDRLSNSSPRSDISRTTYSDLAFDEPENCDQPVDYSKKYSEAPKYTPQATSENLNVKTQQDKRTTTTQSNKLNSRPINYADYQETDLDQPTDYSLRYAEDQTDLTSDISEDRPPSAHEDTMKHFCTEGTPYETPINFSTATSMSDLRAIGGDLNIISKPIKVEPQSSNAQQCDIKQGVEIMSQSDEKDTCSLEEGNKHDNDRLVTASRNADIKLIIPQSSNDMNYESKFSSGMISPEKPVNYCEEGTPGYFSRVSSLSSLEEGKMENVEECSWNREKVGSAHSGQFTPPPLGSVAECEQKEKDCGIKAVTFDSNVLNNQGTINYALETPLMFSRSSSLESLSGCSVPDQPDDVGSVVSEFSRLPSGCISPSEIPDSPTQSPLPRGDHSVMSAPPVNRLNKPPTKNAPQPANRLRSVFEDEVSTFKCEHTPIEFSTRTSLSSLTIDDEPTTTKKVFSSSGERTEGVGCSNPDDSQQPTVPPTPAAQVSGSISSEEDNDDHIPPTQDHKDILASCISQGVNARIKHRSLHITSVPLTKPAPNVTLHHTLHEDRSVQPALDTCITYCTEDTPALLSKAGSHSNLSVCSLIDEQEARDYSDDSSNISGDNGNLLAKCISAGIKNSTKEKYSEPAQCVPQISQIAKRATPPLRPIQNGLPPYLVSQDEVETYVVEGSPFQHSFSSSLSDLTIDSNAENKARIIKRLPPAISTPEKPPGPMGRDMSPTGSLSSVELGSDDGHILDMVIQAGVPKRRDDPLTKENGYVSSGRSSVMMEDKRLTEPKPIREESGNQFPVLAKSDSLSSLSVESFGSNEGDQSILERCIKSGMPKIRPEHKWNDIHSKTLDKNFKARSADRNSNNPQKSHIRTHKSLERNRDESKSRNSLRDPEFENLVATGAFRNCMHKLSKTQEDLSDRISNNETIFVSKLRRDVPYQETRKTHSEMSYQSNKENNLKDGRIVDDTCEFDLSKNVQGTSVAVDSNQDTAADVKTVVGFGNTAEDTKTSCHLTITPLRVAKYRTVTLESITQDGLIFKQSFSGEASQYNFKVRDGSEHLCDEADGNKLPKPTPDINHSFNDSILERSNECPALDSSSLLNDSIVSELNISNESCANMNDSHCGLDEHTSDDGDIRKVQQSKLIYTKLLLQSSFKSSNPNDIDLTSLDSVTEKDVASSLGVLEKRNSTDTWNDNTCPNDVSFPTVSGSLPMLTSFKSDFGDEYTCAGTLPDLLEESVMAGEGSKKPDLTNQLSETNDATKTKTPPFTIDTNQLCNNFQIMTLSNKLGNQPTCSGQASLSDHDSSSRNTSLSHSTIIENEAAMLAKRIRDANYDYPALTESGHSLQSLDLDNVNPPSNMGSLLSLTHSLSGNWNDNSNCYLEKEKVHSSVSKKHHRSQRKKSLPVSLMVKRALGLSSSNHGSSEQLDIHGLNNLDNVKPPSEMEDILDMENSMMSVASIVSEIADTNEEDSTIIFDLKKPFTCPRFGNPPVNIESVNPPSLFNELTESTLENEMEDDDENCLTQTLAYCPEIPSGSDSGTPITSDFGSSAESTPKRVKSNRKYLTPKQKRQIAIDRYKTYTIAAETTEEAKFPASEDTSTSFDLISESPERSSPSGSEGKKGKTNPKQRRMENRERYQTQTVNVSISPPEIAEKPINNDPEIEALKKRLEAKKSMKQKRIENTDRFRTRTLESSFDLTTQNMDSPSGSLNPNPCPSSTQPDIQLSDDVTEAFQFLNQHGTVALNGDIDCETISLVSNEDDSELNSLRMRTFTRSFRNYLPVIESPTAVDRCIEKNLKNMTHTSIQASSFSYLTTTTVNDADDTQSIDFVQNSGTESADQNVYSDSEGESPQQKGKPKITKPNTRRDESVDSNESMETEHNGPKPVRGRRKALYVSPYKRNGPVSKNSPVRTSANLSAKSTRNPAQTKTPNGITCKTQSGMNVKTPVNVTRMNYGSNKTPINSLNRNSTHVTKIKTTVNIRTKSPKNTDISKPVLVRQGTFTKEESTALATGKTIESKVSPSSKLTKPGTIVKALVNTSPSRLPMPPKPSVSATKPQRKPANGESSSKPPSRASSNLTSKSIGGMKKSSSNHSLQSNDSTKISPKPNAARNGNAGSTVNGVTSKPQSKDITSKIANLWKKVEQSKKVPTKPDSRVWITNSEQGSSSQDSCESPLDSPSNGKLIRSSTFDGSPKATLVPSTPKQKSSIAIRVPQSPNKVNSSKVPVSRTLGERNSGIPSFGQKKGKA